MATSTSGLTSISGLASGIDTDSLITSLMQLAARPQTLLKAKLASTNASLTALQTLNTQAATLATTATALTKPSSYAALTASSSSTSTNATAGTTATAGSLTFDVTRLATAHSLIGGAWSSASSPTANPILTITNADGTARGAPLSAASNSPADLAAAINGSASGLSATVVTSSNGDSRLVVTSTSSGDASRFSLAVDTGDGNGPVDYGDTLTQGYDAKLQLGDGSYVTSATNTFSSLMTGVDVTVSKVEAGTTVGVTSDTTGVTKSVQTLIDQLNTLVGTIATNTQAKPSAAGSAAVTSPLSGQSTVVGLRNTLLSQLSGSLGGLNPAAAGISVDRDGNATFDSAVFSKLLASDPTRAQGIVSALAGEVATTAKQASDPYSGSLSLSITGEKSEASGLSDAIDVWTDRLTARQAALKTQYAALETALSKISSQASALSSLLSTSSS